MIACAITHIYQLKNRWQMFTKCCSLFFTVSIPPPSIVYYWRKTLLKRSRGWCFLSVTMTLDIPDQLFCSSDSNSLDTLICWRSCILPFFPNLLYSFVVFFWCRSNAAFYANIVKEWITSSNFSECLSKIPKVLPRLSLNWLQFV